MARIKLLREIRTEKTRLNVGREILCNWPDAVRMERMGLAVILLLPYGIAPLLKPKDSK